MANRRRTVTSHSSIDSFDDALAAADNFAEKWGLDHSSDCPRQDWESDCTCGLLQLMHEATLALDKLVTEAPFAAAATKRKDTPDG